MDVDAVKLPKKLTPEEREQCTRKGLCFRCQKSGHMVSACPAFSDLPKKPCVQCARKEDKLPELKEIEDDDEEEGVAQVHFTSGWKGIFKRETHFDTELSLTCDVCPSTCINIK